MWTSSQILVEIEDSEPRTILAVIKTPVGVIELIGDARVENDTLFIERAHIGGLMPNAIGIAGLNAIGRKLLEEANVRQIVVEGGARTSGRCIGRKPRVIRFPRGG